MFSEQVAREVVTLESIGPVTVSLVEMSGDGNIRPYRYLETALLWDDECMLYIVDSNVNPDQRDYALALFDVAIIPENLARAMHYVLSNNLQEDYRP